MNAIIILVIILLILHGMPLFAGLGWLSVALFYMYEGPDALIMTFLDPYGRLTQGELLLPLVLFTVTGYMLAKSKFPDRLFNVFRTLLLRPFRGATFSVGILAVVVSALFTPLSGASGITIVALGGILMPVLLASGYSRNLSLGIITSSGSLGLLFFPSIPVILYGIISQNTVSIKDLYLAGIMPGLLLILLPSIYIFIVTRKISLPETKDEPEKPEWIKFIVEISIIPLVFMLFLKGKVTISEISLLMFLFFFILETLIFREIKFKQFGSMLKESFSLLGGILAIIFFAMSFTSFLIDHQVPQIFFEWIQNYVQSKYTFLIMLNIFLLVVGALMDIFSAIIVVAPIVIPVAEMFGINMVHLGILFLTNLEIGYITPPVGINLFLSSFRFKEPLPGIYKSVFPFLLILIGAQLIITYIPELSLWLLP
ncbi:MAG: TRAP transporter large permease subunit [Leptospirales bacterium]